MDGTVTTIERPELTFPQEVGDWVRALYLQAEVILEYGSGGSTVLAAEMDGKRVFSVESDRRWAQNMEAYFGANPPASPVTMHWADIGPTGKWGRPKDHSGWQGYHRYPLSVWDREDFVKPDLVLIDGRFRPACLLTAMMRSDGPVTVLFDDYVSRRAYRAIERIIEPVEIRGRMARFEVSPGLPPAEHMTWVIGTFGAPF